MSSVAHRIGGALGVFARRLALQALVSSIVMTGIGLASRDDFALPRAVLADLGLLAPSPDLAAAAPATSGKEPRLPFRPHRTQTAGLLPSEPARAVQPAAAAATDRRAGGADGAVVLFTQCAPACESRDPLLVSTALSTAHARPASMQMPEEPVPAPPPVGDELPPPAALTVPVEDETFLDTTAALPGRALGAAARLVGWGG